MLSARLMPTGTSPRARETCRRLGRRGRPGEPCDRQPPDTPTHDVLARGDRDEVAPYRGGVVCSGQQFAYELRGGVGVDQAAQAEADVPALVEVDAPHALPYPGQRAVFQIV